VIAVQDVGIKVKPVGPHDSPELRIDANRSEILGIPHRLTHLAPERVSEIDEPLAAVVEPKAQPVPFEWWR